MPIAWDSVVFEKFFNAVPYPSNVEEQRDRVSFVDYVGKNLRYSFWLHFADEVVLVSGDTSHPFGADSLFEFCVPCDHITEIPDSYYPGEKGLGFWYGDPRKKHNLTMMLLKRPDGDLKVWPTSAWPDRHSYFHTCSSDDSSKRFDPPIQQGENLT